MFLVGKQAIPERSRSKRSGERRSQRAAAPRRGSAALFADQEKDSRRVSPPTAIHPLTTALTVHIVMRPGTNTIAEEDANERIPVPGRPAGKRGARRAGTSGKERALAWLEERCREMGWQTDTLEVVRPAGLGKSADIAEGLGQEMGQEMAR
jgi:hypothetical protein